MFGTFNIGGGSSLLAGVRGTSAAGERRQDLISRFPEELLHELFDFLVTEDVLCLADANLDCALGLIATEIRLLVRLRRAIISSCPWLEPADLSALVVAFVETDPVISQQVHNHVLSDH